MHNGVIYKDVDIERN